ncbi:MAG: ATP synthase F1 subunit gamma [Ezakiella sp.]|nr:ATP synthase F1 subunit gamma [Ezakiella sp.]MDD7471858.1 ATP synthase F1 subunit gamma [Bacillota bacterium]MDY3923822.1 ATP synthase F1 subunit gamma [Ezakiella sp.]
MAEQMKDIKRRINSVSSIRQITNAMELVSTSKMRKTRLRLESSRPYYTTVIDNIRELLSYTNFTKTPLTVVRETKSRLYIIISGDRGLAGGYTSNLIRFAEEQIVSDEDYVITVGSKVNEHFNKRGYDIVDKFYGLSEDFTFYDAKHIADIVLDLYKKKSIDQVEIIYTKFQSALSQLPTIQRLLPADFSDFEEEDESNVNTLITFEPSPEVMLDYLVEEYVAISIYAALIESSSSEQASRMQAMKNATENADEMIDSLSMKYNRARQASITQELTEIVSGAEALK